MVIKWKNRPKWAKPLSAMLWHHVCESTNRATLKEVKHNIESQKKHGITCFECQAIARRLGL